MDTCPNSLVIVRPGNFWDLFVQLYTVPPASAVGPKRSISSKLSPCFSQSQGITATLDETKEEKEIEFMYCLKTIRSISTTKDFFSSFFLFSVITAKRSKFFRGQC